MATIRKRKNSYPIDYYDPNDNRVRKPFTKRKDVKAYLNKRVSLICRLNILNSHEIVSGFLDSSLFFKARC